MYFVFSYSNRITRDGVKELAKVLKLNTALKVLDLGYNRLEDDGAIHLAEAVGTYNTILEWQVLFLYFLVLVLVVFLGRFFAFALN